MKLKLFALYDEALEAYGMPMSYTTTGQAKRDFSDQVNNKDSPLSKHPEHYKLAYIGDYDNSTGRINSEIPTILTNATDEVIK